MGKLNSKILKEIFETIGKKKNPIIGPMVGYGSGVHEFGEDTYMVISTDPCIDVPQKELGWLLINYAASDVAIFGAHPEYCTVNLLAPEETTDSEFKEVINQIHYAASELGITIITGHTGRTNKVIEWTGTCTTYGFIKKNKLLTAKGITPKQKILITKSIGLETLTNFATTKAEISNQIFGTKKTRELVQMSKVQTCVKEALLLAEKKLVTSMHDITEGGIVTTLNDVSDVSGMGFTINIDEITIIPEIEILAQHFELTLEQILSLSSTGTILASSYSKNTDKIIKSMKEIGLNVKNIGEFSGDNKRIMIHEGKEKEFPKEHNDPYIKIISS